MAHYVFDDQRSQFAHQLSMLPSLREFVSTDSAMSMVRGNTPIDGAYFHLSFDEGLACLARNAAAILDENGIAALVFVNSAVAGNPTIEERGQWEKATNYAKSLGVMDWATLLSKGFEIGAHTRTHVRLTSISYDPRVLIEKISGCKAEIETATGRPCHYFASRFGHLGDIYAASIQCVDDSGFDAAFSGVRGTIFASSGNNNFVIARHHFEPQWPICHLRYFLASGRFELLRDI
ncbi:hypothetical protein BB931_01215 [Spiribacter salinus]|nr:hypothetical protein [Spiribacter salinus]